jgi:hypothetical protein
LLTGIRLIDSLQVFGDSKQRSYACQEIPQ